MAQAAFPFALPQPSAAAARPGWPTGAGEPTHPAATAAANSGQAPHHLERSGFEIGWDHARYHLTPPVAHLHAASPVRQGWQAGRAAFGGRTLKAGAAARQWLGLRLAAWQHGQAFEAVQVTPHFIKQIDASHCPITRAPLLLATGGDHDAVVQRLNPHAAYAAGNLAVTSRAAGQARAGLDCHALMAKAHAALDACDRQLDGHSAEVWQRLAVLASFATPLPHGVAATVPLRVLPPNRVRVINPVQALQVMLTLQFTQGGYARRLLTLAALLPSRPGSRSGSDSGSDLRQTFQIFMHTLLARRLNAGQNLGPAATRQAMEDSWADTLVNRRWQRLALRLTPADCELLLERASRRGLCVGGGRWLSASAATDGWQLGDGLGDGSAAAAAAAAAAAPAADAAAGNRAAPAAPATEQAEAPAGQTPAFQAGAVSVAGATRPLARNTRKRGSQNLAS